MEMTDGSRGDGAASCCFPLDPSGQQGREIFMYIKEREATEAVQHRHINKKGSGSWGKD